MRERGAERTYEEIISENFPNLEKETDIQVQEAQRIPNKMNSKRPTPRHILTKMAKVKHKESIFKTARMKKQVTYKGNPIRLQARREWQEIFRVLKERN